jgi:hypothetical protein
MHGDLVYAGILVVSAIFALGQRQLVQRARPYAKFNRHSWDGVLGLLLTVALSGRMAMYSLLAVLAHLVLFKTVKEPKFFLFFVWNCFGKINQKN